MTEPTLKPKDIDLHQFAKDFCDTLDESGLAESYNVRSANYKHFRITQSKSQPNKIKVAYFAIAGQEFELMIDIEDVVHGPDAYMNATLALVKEAKDLLIKGDIVIGSDK